MSDWQAKSRPLAATIVAATDEGWLALTDAGDEVHLPSQALVNAISLRPGQRVNAERDGDRVVTVTIGSLI